MRIGADIPVLRTERLVLRAPKPADEESYVAFFASERALHIGGNGTRSRGWQAFAVEWGHWCLRGFGMWAVTWRDDDRCLGYVGCWYPGGNPEREIGWQVWAEVEGLGVAQEAARAALAYAFGPLRWRTAVSYIDHDNLRSIRLAERLGAVRDDAAPRPEGDHCLVFRHPAPARAA